MKITKHQLKQIIKEELAQVLEGQKLDASNIDAVSRAMGEHDPVHTPPSSPFEAYVDKFGGRGDRPIVFPNPVGTAKSIGKKFTAGTKDVTTKVAPTERAEVDFDDISDLPEAGED